MKKYIVVLVEPGEETVVGRYSDIEAAKRHLRNVRYYPPFRRTEESLDLSDDGMSGTGYDESGHFSYAIKPITV